MNTAQTHQPPLTANELHVPPRPDIPTNAQSTYVAFLSATDHLNRAWETGQSQDVIRAIANQVSRFAGELADEVGTVPTFLARTAG